MIEQLLVFIALLLAVGLLVTGIIFTKKGYGHFDEGKRQTVYIVLGWVFIGIVTLAFTLLTIYYLAINSGVFLLFGLLIGPLIVIIGIPLFIAIGIVELIKGYKVNPETGKRNGNKIAAGYVFFAVATLIFISFVGVIAYLQAHPISFM